MAQPAPDGQPEAPGFRVAKRTYGPTVDPLVDVLVQLWDWSLERRRRQAQGTKKPEPDDSGDAA